MSDPVQPVLNSPAVHAPDAHSLDRAVAPPSPHRRVLVRVAIALSIVAVIAGCFCLWGALRYQDAMAMAHDAQKQFATLNATEAFTPPAPNKPADESRWSTLLRVRRETIGGLSPALVSTINELFGAGSPGAVRLSSALLLRTNDLQKLLDAHLAALRGAKMSPDEYRWRLGQAVVAALRAPAPNSVGGAYRDALDSCGKLIHSMRPSAASGTPGASVQAMIDGLAAPYAKQAAASALDEAKDLDLGVSVPAGQARAAYVLDLALVASQSLHGDDLPGGGGLKSLLGSQ